MSNIDDTPKKQLELSGSGTGGKKRTAIGAGEGGEGDGPKEFPGSSNYPSFEIIPRVVICEPHELVRAGMTAMLPFCNVIGSTSEGAQAWELVKRVKPQLVITEISVDGINGIDLCKRIREFSPEIAILVSTHSYNATKYFHQTMRSGASGIYLKRSGCSELVKAVVEILNGQKYCDESIERLVHQHPVQMDTLNESLTTREIDVLIRLDLRNKEISEELDIPLKNVEKSIFSILRKLNSQTRTEAALKAVTLGCILLPVIPPRNIITGTTEEEDLALEHAENALRDLRQGFP